MHTGGTFLCKRTFLHLSPLCKGQKARLSGRKKRERAREPYLQSTLHLLPLLLALGAVACAFVHGTAAVVLDSQEHGTLHSRLRSGGTKRFAGGCARARVYIRGGGAWSSRAWGAPIGRAHRGRGQPQGAAVTTPGSPGAVDVGGPGLVRTRGPRGGLAGGLGSALLCSGNAPRCLSPRNRVPGDL